MYQVIHDFEGANCRLLSVTEDEVQLDVELRDTTEDWFYWCFRVDGAAGRTLRFTFPSSVRVGYYGAAVSHDFDAWHWQYDEAGHEGASFTYTFAPDEDRVWFAHDMLYRPARFEAFAARHDLVINTLCISERGRRVPYVTCGEGAETILLTARHHACEATGSYVLEGVLESLLASELVRRYRIVCVPFVDYDGVTDGDQGKGRAPFDHNRDYEEGVPARYASVAAIREEAEKCRLRFAFDFHSPWHLGGHNDHVMIPIKHYHILDNILRFSRLLEVKTGEGEALPHRTADNLLPDVEWNKFGAPCCGTYMGRCGAELAFTLETPYFMSHGVMFTQARGVETGRAFTSALLAYLNG